MAPRAVARANPPRQGARNGVMPRFPRSGCEFFFDEWDTPEERLKGATDILRTLAGIAEKGKKVA